MENNFKSVSGLSSWEDDENLQIEVEDQFLSRQIKEHMRAMSDIEEVLNDPSLNQVRSEVAQITGSKLNKNNTSFVREAFAEAVAERISLDELMDIKAESAKLNVNELSADWVREWHHKKQMEVKSSADKERADFIYNALGSENSETSETSVTYGIKEEAHVVQIRKDSRRPMILKVVTLSAAAVIGVLVLFSVLMPSGNPDKIFNTYYSSFNAFSPVTRGETHINEIFSSSINYYKTGDYKNASAGFAEVVASNPSFSSASFFLGLTDIESGNYEMAIKHLLSEITGKGQYSIEAKWYLGLSYLKSGNTNKAKECFRELSESRGYFSERSEKILRRLK